MQLLIKNALRYLWLRIVPDKIFLKIRYKKNFGRELNLNNPKSLNEKMQWLKLNDRSELHTICADKLLVRNYVKDCVGEKFLIPLIFNTSNPNLIIQDSLPNVPFIIKSNNGCGTNFIVRDKANANWQEIRKICTKWLKENNYYGGKEWQYKNIKPQIVIEELLEDSNNKIPNDYKFHCFHGKVKCIYVSIDREGVNKRNIYDENWNPLFFTWAAPNKDTSKLRGEEIDKPINFDLMVSLAEKLASKFMYVRVDFYNINGKIYFGELTFHHGSGFDFIKPLEWDFKLGEMLKLPLKN
jgi:hypothetical protein